MFTLFTFSMLTARRLVSACAAATVLMGAGGCASLNPRDPLEGYNRVVHSFNDKIDTYALKPIAEGYRTVVPSIVRAGVRNFFGNLNDVWIGVNNMLQGKVAEALSDWMRFAINSTFGLAGLIDVASDTRLEKHNEDFGQTLGWWGVPPGPYFVVPFLGPSTVRDAAALPANLTASSYARHQVFSGVSEQYETRTVNGGWALEIVNARAGALDATNLISGAALDPYSFTRDAFLQRRQSLIYDGSPPASKYDDEDDDDKPQAPPKPGAALDGATPDRLPAVTSFADTLPDLTPSAIDAAVGAPPGSNVNDADVPALTAAGSQTDKEHE